MEVLFEELARVCEAQVELQEAQLACCRDQYRAIRVNDVEYVEAKALDIEALNQRHAECELLRQTLTEQVVEHYGLAQECAALGILAELAPEPVRERLQRCADRLPALRQDMAQVVLNGTRSLQQAADAIYRCMDAFKGCVQLVPEGGPAMVEPSTSEAPAAAVS